MIYRINTLNTEELPKYKICTLGDFDGVHLGHQKLLTKLKKSIFPNSQKVIITFLKENKKQLQNIKEREEQLCKFGQNIDILEIVLNEEMYQKSKKDFINFLKNLNIEKIIVGLDYRFGHNAAGQISDLEKEFIVQKTQFVEQNNMKISSSKIIEYLKKGNIKKVNEFLGYNYFIIGKVIHGNKIGRTINFPTINLEREDINLKNGVYATKIEYKGKVYNSITNVGYAPTVRNEKIQKIETNIYENFEMEIYGEEVRIIFFEYIREEKNFKNLEELKKQINLDIIQVKEKYENS